MYRTPRRGKTRNRDVEGSSCELTKAPFSGDKNKKLDPISEAAGFYGCTGTVDDIGTRPAKVKARSIDRGTCVDSETSERARSNRPLPVPFHLDRR